MKSESCLKFCLLTCFLLFSIACSNIGKLSGNEFLIEGKISDLEDGIVLNFYRWENGAGVGIGTDTVRNGRFVFKGDVVSNPERLGILSYGDGFPLMSLDVWVASGSKIKIKGKGKLYPTWKVRSSISNQKEANRYNNKNRDIFAELVRISVEKMDISMKMATASSRDESLSYRKIIDSLDLVSNALKIKETFGIMDIMEKSNITPMWIDKMRWVASSIKNAKADNEYASDLRQKAEDLYSRLSEDDKNTLLGYEITANLFPPSVVGIGDNMADSDFFDINGITKHLSDYSGKYILLDFWSHSCGPCLMSIPEMKEVSEIFSDILNIVSISLDTDDTWKETMSAHDMPWIHIRDPKGYGGVAAYYGVVGIPNYVLISPDGKIIDTWMGFGAGFLKRRVSQILN